MPHQPSSLGFDCKDIQSDIECIFGSTGKTKKVQIKVNSNVTGPEQSMIWKKTIRDLKQRQFFCLPNTASMTWFGFRKGHTNMASTGRRNRWSMQRETKCELRL